ncbi:MAG: T9SS C-terminal target domain-containing protein, partial [Bacteroidota bacterium]
MKNFYIIPFVFFLCLSFAAKAQVVVNDASFEEGISYSWTSAQEIILDGIVYLKPGSSLTIEAGTVIKGLDTPSNGDPTSVLVVSAGATINALGEASCPIIFTSVVDDVSDPFDLTTTDAGLWGGLVILGEGILGNDEPSDSFFGTASTYDDFGGSNNDDGSGTLRYVSVRHAGASVTPGVEISGITFAGVGRNTTVEYVEAFACVDDGIAFFGGAVNTKYLVSAYNQDDAFDIDLGYVGLGQHWFGLSRDGNVSFGIEWDGARPDENPIYSNPILSNVTLIGPSSIRSELEGVYMRDGTAGTLSNSI